MHLAYFILDIITTQHIIRAAWTKPNALYKTTAGIVQALRVHLRGWWDIGDCTLNYNKKSTWNRCSSCLIILSYGKYLLKTLCRSPLRAYFQNKTSANTKGFKDFYPHPGKDIKLMNKTFCRLLFYPLLQPLHICCVVKLWLSTEILTIARGFPVCFYKKKSVFLMLSFYHLNWARLSEDYIFSLSYYIHTTP